MSRRHHLLEVVCLFLGIFVVLLCAGMAVVAFVKHKPERDPGPQWVHDHGSTYWSCTSDGHELRKDANTGAVALAPDSRHCDWAG